MQPIVLNVEHVAKNFELPRERQNSVKSGIVNVFRPHDKTVTTQRALRDIHFSVENGEFLGIVGRNGSGKSTLLKILASIYQPTKGSVSTKGKVVPFIELGVGFNPELTGRENVFLNGALLGFSKQEVASRYNSIVEFAELEKFMDQKLKNYSSGMQVRLAFAVAVTADADILIVDEVLAVGDAAFQKKCFNYFMSLKQQKKTVILVTHDMEAVRQYCDRAILIEKGKIATQGKPEDVAQAYLRLFSDDKVSKVEEPQGTRWGDERAVFGKPQLTIDAMNVSLKVSLRVKDYVEFPLVGFSIENMAGQRILGTNNELVGKRLSSLKKGDTVDFNWSLPNVLINGDYKINLAAESKGDSIALDWWNGAAEFRVEKDHPTPYVIYPDFKLKATVNGSEN